MWSFLKFIQKNVTKPFDFYHIVVLYYEKILVIMVYHAIYRIRRYKSTATKTQKTQRRLKVKKRIVSIICVALLLITIPASLISCGNEKLYYLGPYEIKADEYTYLIGMYKKRLLVNLGLEGTGMSAEISSGITLGDYLDSMYREEFEMSVYTLLYSQSLFDDYNLSLTDEQLKTIDTVIENTKNYFGGYSDQAFKRILKNFGFTMDTMRSVYTMQAKQMAVIDHLYGSDYSKLTDDALKTFYKDTYLRFQAIVINNTYEAVKDSDGKTSYVYLTDRQKEFANKLIDEMQSLLVDKDESKDYPTICAGLEMTKEELFADLGAVYDKLYEKYSYDKVYPNGYYMVAPVSLSQMISSEMLLAAFKTKVGDVADPITAKITFEKSGTININGKDETIKAGDYFEYGKAFIRRLELDDEGYKREESKIFFDDSDFIEQAGKSAFYDLLKNYEEKECKYTMMRSSAADSYKISEAIANELDYRFLYGTETTTTE